MMGYPQKEGKHGSIYQISNGITVAPDEYGTWMLIIRPGPGQKKKRSFGKSEEGRRQAIKAAELVAVRMGLNLEKQADSETRTFEMLIGEWYSLNEQRWQPGTKERYQYIVREFLRPLHNLPMDQVDRHRIKRLLVDLLKIRSANTVEVIHAVISGIFSEAIDLGYTDKNPAYGLLKKILPPKNKRNLTEADPFNLYDRDKFLQAAWAKFPIPTPLSWRLWQ
jgi:hypothetical protein